MKLSQTRTVNARLTRAITLGLIVAFTHAGEYEAKLVREFDACLPEKPGW